MKISILLVLLNLLFAAWLCAANEQKLISKITVAGTVYCDTCSNNSFSRHSYFLPGVRVQIECKFKANSSKAEQISLSLNKTTDKYGMYKFEIPSFEEFECQEGKLIESICRATVVRSSASSCNTPGLKGSTKQMATISKQAHLCIYSLNALNYRPHKRNLAVCGAYKEEMLARSLNSSEFLLPFFPPFGFPLPPWPSLPLPHFPQFPPLPPLPLPHFPQFPPLPPLPFPFPPIPFLPKPPSLPFPFPPLPPLPSIFTPPSPPPPPHFSLLDPRTWFPFLPPSPPNCPQTQQP